MTPDNEWRAMLAWVASEEPDPLDDGANWPAADSNAGTGARHEA